MNEKNIINQIDKLAWFHSIDFGEYASQGRFKPGTPQNRTLYGAFELLNDLDLSSSVFLDIGTADGILSFGAKKLGAETVFAVDTFKNEAFLLSRELLGYTAEDIKYIPRVQISKLGSVFDRGSMDVIACCGVIYHMLNPMEAFLESRKLLKDDGYLILETPYEASTDRALLIFNGTEKIYNEPHTYFVPTKAALEGMANLSGYKITAYRILVAPKRITYLLRAVSRDELIEDPNTPPFIKQMLKRDTCDDNFRFKDLEAGSNEHSTVKFRSDIPEFCRDIHPKTEKVSFPYHPEIGQVTYGRTRWEQPDGNTKTL